MAPWAGLRADRPDLAAAGRGLLYQFGVGLAFIATVRRDGGPRLHPMCPLVTEDALYGFLIPSPKRTDLLRDPRYAMHSYPCEHNEDAFYLTGRARLIERADVRALLRAQFLAERPRLRIPDAQLEKQSLFEFGIDRCLLTRTTAHGDPDPQHVVWHDHAAAG